MTSSTTQLASKRTSQRYSTYSTTPSETPSTASAQQEIANIEEGLEKLQNKKLAGQRFVPTQEKTEHLSKLALGAKLERALGRRMGSQDAVMRPRKKTVSEVEKPRMDEEKVLVAA